jgi:hypothetical protein
VTSEKGRASPISSAKSSPRCYRARQVLDDCRVALQLLEAEKDLQCWRIHWVAALALVRAVGHVLDKVDGADPKIGDEAHAAFKRWKGNAPEHVIFREFIDRERNNILKEYEFNLHPEEHVQVTLIGTLQPLAGGDPIKTAEIIPIGENIYRPLLGGFREGDDARDVLSEAMDWWEAELAAIERSVSTK